jgi:hypothetical protein
MFRAMAFRRLKIEQFINAKIAGVGQSFRHGALLCGMRVRFRTRMVHGLARMGNSVKSSAY